MLDTLIFAFSCTASKAIFRQCALAYTVHELRAWEGATPTRACVGVAQQDVVYYHTLTLNRLF